MKGNIFDIQRFSVHDGPGIRTIVFFKGCPLRCIWCHNPESQKVRPNVALYSDKCRACGECAGKCEHRAHVISDAGAHTVDRSLCTECGECISSCPFGALEIFGKEADSAEIMDEVMRDGLFYKNSGGGVTFSGGEPLMQGDFLVELLTLSKEKGLNTAMETSGFAKPELIKRVAPLTDLFLFDVKETNDERHKELTGVPFTPIYENLKLLDSLGANIVLRCPLIPDINTEDEHIEAIAKIAAELKSVSEVNVMAYHTLGNGKYDAIGFENKMAGKAAMTEEEKKALVERISARVKELGRDIKVC